MTTERMHHSLLLVVHTVAAVTQFDILMDLYASTNGPSWSSNTNWNVTTDNVCVWLGVKCIAGIIVEIRLGINQLSGTLPPSLSYLTSLQTLDLATNQVTGTLPPSWGNLSSLQYFYLKANKLTGSLPPSWAGMTSLRTLFLDGNQFTGLLPPSWGNITSLQTLNLYDNRLSDPPCL